VILLALTACFWIAGCGSLIIAGWYLRRRRIVYRQFQIIWQPVQRADGQWEGGWYVPAETDDECADVMDAWINHLSHTKRVP